MNQSQHDLPQATTNTPAPSQATTQTSTPAGISADLPKNSNNVASAPIRPKDDLVNLIRTVRLLWKHKWWIAAGTLVFTIGGAAYALLATPVYTSEAIIAPKESNSNSTAAGLLAQMGDMGGLLASQMGGEGTTLERIAIIATGHDLAEEVIVRHNLLPLLFPAKYDFKNNCWKTRDPKKIPTIRNGVRKLTKKVVTAATNVKKSVLTLKVSIYDSVLAEKVAAYYLEELDNKIRSNIIRETRIKRAYLDAQMKSTADPWVMQKLQALVGMELEKSMMVAGSSFDVLVTPMVPYKKSKPQAGAIIAACFCAGFFLTAAAMYLSDSIKNSCPQVC